ncbi:potassium channel protein [Halobiforma lacisalsi AJ5]|uniref:Potassium channel protein n=1 Tax=Natronobacterium lacisalsi AJ5 TaxID=358396 RepID=M0QTC6_NATLA|nr:TrkA C-terminal domain-containing protein [Halobiforma lacisalsi]APW96705.1 potassium channel protein [Halobiforma lacisalsi AJ5]EMA32010.1 potassium channel protein [Halobiforma lacisalsi AJ5]
MRDISYEPRNVRETLVELKDSSELAVDLAYSALRYDDLALADEVLELESRVDYLQYHVRIALMLAAKRADEAERLVGLHQIASSAVRITEAAADVARLVLEDGGVPEAFDQAFPEADERLVRATVDPGSDLAGSHLRESRLDLETGVRLIAIRREEEWAFSPEGDDRLEAGDVIVGRGPQAGIEAVYRRATGDAFPSPVTPAESSDALERAAETVVELKDAAELAVGLSYGAARFDDEELAREVFSVEDRSDEWRNDLEAWVVDIEGWDADELRGLLRLATASEEICDAAVDIAELVVRNVELPPVFGEALSDSEEGIGAVHVGPDGDVAGQTVGDLEGELETGVVVLAIRRTDGDWTFDPAGDVACSGGDTLLVRGPPLGIDRLRSIAGSADGLE